MDQTPDWSKEFKSLLSSPLGKELLRTLKEDLHASKVQSAEAAPNMESGYGLLKEASGVMLAVAHLEHRAVVPKDEGGQDK